MRLYALASSVLFFVVLLLYYPGRNAGYLLDDFNILEQLGTYGGVNSIGSLKVFLQSGGGGPLGRPISLLTFVANAQTWPADPFYFVITNIFVHALNAVLVFFFVVTLLRSIGGVKGNNQQIFFIAGFAAIFWALHPFHTSTVLYIVQRMTLLSAFFSLACFISYLLYRSLFLTRKTMALVSLASSALFSVLAVLSKENAILIPLQIMLLELLLRIKNEEHPKIIRGIYWGVLVPAGLVVLLYMLKVGVNSVVLTIEQGHTPHYGREFTMCERLLTQGRVLWGYLYDLLLPKMQSAGVFHDRYSISKGLFEPITTLLGWAAHGLVIAFSVVKFKRYSLICFGILWFYLGHLLESTIIMLELKFEHRNYLPSIGLAISFSALVYERIRSTKIRWAVLVFTGALFGALLWNSASLWGKPYQAGLVWLAENPASERALENAARNSLIYASDIDGAKKHMQKMVAVHPTAANELKYLLAFCETFDGSPPNWIDLGGRIPQEPRNWSMVRVIDQLVGVAMEGRCNLLTYDGFKALANGFRASKLYMAHRSSKLINETEFKAAVYFGDTDLISRLGMPGSDEATALKISMFRAGLLATYGNLQMAENVLIEAIEKSNSSRDVGSNGELKEAEEILKIIQLERTQNQ